jgi:hypothetical protein
MSHNPDFQKDEIIAHEKRVTAAKKRENESYLAWQQEQPREFRMQTISGLASRFEGIMYAPDYSTDERRAKLLAWAWENRHAITHALETYDAEQVSA